MANSFTPTHKTVFGNQIVQMGIVTFTDGGASNVSTSFKKINHVILQPSSAATYINAVTHSTSVFTAGSAATGDDFHCIVFGV